VSSRASSALRELLRLAPNRAVRLNADGTRAEVPVSDLRSGDLIVLRPGDHVAMDGQVQEGTATLNESMLTGESWPVHKQPGDTIFAGTINLDRRLLASEAHTDEETALAHINDAERWGAASPDQAAK
jgi:P-type E1-E2 ATPase